MVFLTTFLKYFLQDLPVIATAFFCMWCVVGIWLPNQTIKRKWITIVAIEGFEHLVLPLILLVILVSTDNGWSWILFHLTLNLFLFGFLGKVVVKAKGRDQWMRVGVIAVFTYFFVFMYPFILITIQLYTPVGGWFILGTTAAIFGALYWFNKRRLHG